MTASVGRIVHYASTKESGGKCWAAIIIAVNPDGSCDLGVFQPQKSSRRVKAWLGELLMVIDVREGQAAGDWHWPERVE